MADTRKRGLATLNFSGKIALEADDVVMAIAKNESGGRDLRIDLSALADAAIPKDSLLDVVFKHGESFERESHSVGTWGSVDLSAISIALNISYSLRRMTVMIQVVEPTGSKLLAASDFLRAPKEETPLEGEGPTRSIITFDVDRKQVLPVLVVLDPEGPKVVFGKYGPASVPASRQDLGFMLYGLPSAVEKIALVLFGDENGELAGDLWDEMRGFIAKSAGMNNWEDVHKKAVESIHETNRLAAAGAEAFMKNKKIEREIKAMIDRATLFNPESEA